jgi:hypothetical protein
MVTKQEIAKELDRLNQEELNQVADYLTFLRYRSRIKFTPNLDDAHISALYAEFADEDRELAEQGMGDYADALRKEDAQ